MVGWSPRSPSVVSPGERVQGPEQGATGKNSVDSRNAWERGKERRTGPASCAGCGFLLLRMLRVESGRHGQAMAAAMLAEKGLPHGRMHRHGQLLWGGLKPASTHPCWLCLLK